MKKLPLLLILSLLLTQFCFDGRASDLIKDQQTGIIYKINQFGDICLDLQDCENPENIKIFIEANLKKIPSKAFIADLKIEKASLIPFLVKAGFEHNFTNTVHTEWVIRNNSSLPYPFTTLCGAVVVLINEKSEVLLVEDITRPHQWGFPGGIVHFGEDSATTAVREVREETGLVIGEENIKLIGNFQRINCRYGANENTHIYLCKQYQGALKIQESEIKQAHWVPLHLVVSEKKFNDIPLDHYNMAILKHIYAGMKSSARLKLPDPRQFYKEKEKQDPKDMLVLELIK